MGWLKCQQCLEIMLESGRYLAVLKKCSGSGCFPLTGIVRSEELLKFIEILIILV